MSTFEKSIILLPEPQPPSGTAFGIAHKYTKPGLTEKEREAFQNAILKKHAAD